MARKSIVVIVLCVCLCWLPASADVSFQHTYSRSNLNLTRPKELLEHLSSRESGWVTIEEAVDDWVKSSDIEYLVSQLDRKDEPAMMVVLSISSYLGDGRSTVADEAYFMLLGFKTGKYPPGLYSSAHSEDLKERMLSWLREEGHIGPSDTSATETDSR